MERNNKYNCLVQVDVHVHVHRYVGDWNSIQKWKKKNVHMEVPKGVHKSVLKFVHKFVHNVHNYLHQKMQKYVWFYL